MPGMEMPVRMTTAMLFFVAGGVASYFALQNPDLWWIARCSFAFFVALGPVHWLLQNLLVIPLSRKEERCIGDTLGGDIAQGLAWVFQFGLMLYALYLGYSHLTKLASGDAPSPH